MCRADDAPLPLPSRVVAYATLHNGNTLPLRGQALTGRSFTAIEVIDPGAIVTDPVLSGWWAISVLPRRERDCPITIREV